MKPSQVKTQCSPQRWGGGVQTKPSQVKTQCSQHYVNLYLCVFLNSLVYSVKLSDHVYVCMFRYHIPNRRK